MSDNQYELLLTDLFADYEKKMTPANDETLINFRKTAISKNVPDSVIAQLTEFYKISNGIPCLNGFDFHSCDDDILFEWWSDNEIWLGQYDDDILRWTKDKFCLGDSANISYSPEYEFSTLYELIEKVYNEKNE